MSASIVNCVRNSIKSQRGVFFQSRATFAVKKPTNYADDISILEGFHKAATANADGCIHVDNAQEMFRKIKAMSVPGNEYPDGRKHIVAYVRAEYSWAEGADAAFKKCVTDWSTERRGIARQAKKDAAEAKKK
jgi:hypothetical protein